MIIITLSRLPYGIALKFAGSTPDQFQELLTSFKFAIAENARRYDGNLKQWIVRESHLSWLMLWCKQVERKYETQIVDDYTASEPPPRRHSQSPDDEAYRALHLLPSAPAPLIKAAYRELAKLNHPDHGGDTRQMQILNAAYQKLLDRMAA